jgi:hypothetical protein
VVLAFAFLPSLSKGGTSTGILQKLEQKLGDGQAAANALEGKPTDKRKQP